MRGSYSSSQKGMNSVKRHNNNVIMGALLAMNANQGCTEKVDCDFVNVDGAGLSFRLLPRCNNMRAYEGRK